MSIKVLFSYIFYTKDIKIYKNIYLFFICILISTQLKTHIETRVYNYIHQLA